MRISIVIVIAWLGSTAMAQGSNVTPSTAPPLRKGSLTQAPPPGRCVPFREVRRMLFQRGFFRIPNLIIRAEPISLDLHIPYWIGFYDAGGSVRLRVLDAVRGTFEGGKAQAFFQDWLTDEEGP